MIDKTLIFNKLKEHKNFNTDLELARFLGIPPQNLDVWKKNKTFKTSTINVLIDKFPEVREAWFLTGEGNMLKETQAEEENFIEFVPLLPISAQGGTLNEFVVSVGVDGCEKIISPVKGADFAMEVTGDSMYPEYPSGSRILIKRINEKAFIDWGRVYVLDTCNGSVIKRIFPSGDAGKIRCVSINEEYPPFEVAFEDIYGIYRVLLCMSVK